MEVWGVCVLKGYFIQYKFILPSSIKHSSYTYQKLFRAIYGYTQAVYKSSGKKYHYHREGLLSNIPHIRSGKNCVTIPKTTLQLLTKFFQTGANPTHKWQTKGDWKAVYYMDEKGLNMQDLIKSVEDWLKRTTIKLSKSKISLYDLVYTESDAYYAELIKEDIAIILSELKKITDDAWFQEALQNSPKLQKIKDLAKKLSSN